MTLIEREIIQNSLRKSRADLFPRPIRDKKTYEHFLEVTNVLMKGLAAEPTIPKRDREAIVEYLDVVTHFVEEYETSVFPKPDIAPNELLAFLMEQGNLTQDQLANVLGTSQPAVSEILKGKRKLTTDHIRRLSKRFKIGPEAFFASAA